VKTIEQRRARELRAQGWSVKEIERALGVARSSVSRWVRHVELDADLQRSLAERGQLAAHAAVQRKAKAARDIRRSYEDFWLAHLDLDRGSLCPSTVNTYSKASQRKRTNTLPYGTCAVAVYDTRLVQTIYGSIQAYAGFDRPEWLD
jgi:predicted transcriptional regulator